MATIHRSKPRGTMPTRDMITRLSLLFNVLLVMALFFLGFHVTNNDSAQLRGNCLTGKQLTFHGGHPESLKSGTCWCGGKDNYCLCGPSMAIDLVVASGDDHIWLVRRKDTNQLATMGGFVMLGETVEQTVSRELMEEMGISFKGSPHLLGVYSDPRRDNRRHTVSAVFYVQVPENATPHAADDVKDVMKISLGEIEEHSYFADHKTILLDYRHSVNGVGSKQKDVFDNVARSTCKGEYHLIQ